jgi:hypothetical protein
MVIILVISIVFIILIKLYIDELKPIIDDYKENNKIKNKENNSHISFEKIK